MKTIRIPFQLSLTCLLLFSACNGQNQTTTLSETVHLPSSAQISGGNDCNTSEETPLTPLYKLPFLENLKPKVADQIGEYVREIFQDSRKNLWFGTLKFGVCRYDGDTLMYFSTPQGLPASQINGITEDIHGNIWFATTNGVSKFDGKSFRNFTGNEGLRSDQTWCILADSKGYVWVGTAKGLSRYDGNTFSDFDLPTPDIESPSTTLGLLCISEMLEDSKGNIWFARDGYGVCKWDGQLLTHLTKKDGLCTNSIKSLMEDNNGNLWFGSIETPVPVKDDPNHFITSNDGGLSMYDGTTFKQFPGIRGLSGNDVYPLYQDKSGDIWIGSKHHGVFRFNGDSFELISETDGFTNNCIQSILQDNTGNLWFGFSGGLFRLNNGKLVNVTREFFQRTGC